MQVELPDPKRAVRVGEGAYVCVCVWKGGANKEVPRERPVDRTLWPLCFGTAGMDLVK